VKLYLDSPNTPLWRGAQLKSQGQIYLTYIHGLVLVICPGSKLILWLRRFWSRGRLGCRISP